MEFDCYIRSTGASLKNLREHCVRVTLFPLTLILVQTQMSDYLKVPDICVWTKNSLTVLASFIFPFSLMLFGGGGGR